MTDPQGLYWLGPLAWSFAPVAAFVVMFAVAYFAARVTSPRARANRAKLRVSRMHVTWTCPRCDARYSYWGIPPSSHCLVMDRAERLHSCPIQFDIHAPDVDEHRGWEERYGLRLHAQADAWMKSRELRINGVILTSEEYGTIMGGPDCVCGHLRALHVGRCQIGDDSFGRFDGPCVACDCTRAGYLPARGVDAALIIAPPDARASVMEGHTDGLTVLGALIDAFAVDRLGDVAPERMAIGCQYCGQTFSVKAGRDVMRNALRIMNGLGHGVECPDRDGPRLFDGT